MEIIAMGHARRDALVQRFLEVLRGEEFKRRIDALGGYVLEAPGELRQM